MRIKIISDLHLEFQVSNLIKIHFFEKLIGSDMIIVAGDLSNSDCLLQHLTQLKEVVKQPVIFIPGNHDYYGSQKCIVDEKLKSFKHEGIIILNNDIFIKDDVIFLGSTGWFSKVYLALTHGYNDYAYIHDIITNNFGRTWGDQSYQFFDIKLTDLEKERQGKKVICISHMVPSYELITPENRFKYEDSNCFFVNHYLENIIKEYSPDYWIFGHTHHSEDQMLYNTRCISNPFGYYDINKLNRDFNYDLTIEV